ncbi:PAS domain S-box-containing protein [Halanaerobium saccharolyticum]|uniref:PAS domain S-box-containing protein n=1 Tax=Halanaerobium saccharolyticum TaxID=43595 RepID=A0A4R7Z9Y7_9FIRM|nr:PAS domain-containing protein [Halanaerobium saccharolyticum]RAK04208.1 PAS domain S-box-containing protein [Halanaerobium saccharolyticum]TDW06769.1 PAS domain S-box-containing protein [Halanaerobium saccharolyticum]TDX62404.1 PAS domain S-box-containing protein [Halanaerobium saccharolyticum]
MKDIIKIEELRKRVKLELDIIAEFFAVEDLKMAVLTPEAELEFFSQQNTDFEKEVNKTRLTKAMHEKIKAAPDMEIKNILAEYLDEFKSEFICFKVQAAEYIYIIYFSLNSKLKSSKTESIKLFKRQLKAVLDDIYKQETIKDDLSQKNDENKTLKKEKYITASALDSVPGNISILDKKGKIVYTNSSWEQFAAANGALPGNVGIGENYLDVCKEAVEEGDLFSARAYNGILSVLNNEIDDFSMDYPCHSPEEKRWFRMYVSSFKGIGSYEVMILHQNITREVLSEKNYEKILNEFPASIIKYDSEKRLVYFNQKALELFDLTEKDLNKAFSDLKIAGYSKGDYLEKLNYVIENNKSTKTRIIVKKDEQERYYDNFLVPDFEANKLKTITSIIPDQLVNQTARSHSPKHRNHYLQLFNNFPDALVLLNLDERVINANKKFCQLFEYEMEELKNKELDSLIVPAGKEGEAKYFSQLVLTGTQLEHDVCRINSRGEKLNLQLTAFPVLLNNNRIGVYAIYREKIK